MSSEASTRVALRVNHRDAGRAISEPSRDGQEHCTGERINEIRVASSEMSIDASLWRTLEVVVGRLVITPRQMGPVRERRKRFPGVPEGRRSSILLGRSMKPKESSTEARRADE